MSKRETDIRCKMCGGELEFEPGSSMAVCQYCGSKQSVPKTQDEVRINLFNRANHLRRNSEYDKAMDLYNKVLNEDDTDAEAYWSLVLCRYGIEYVEDPGTHKRLPTMNRAQTISIYADEDYRAAISNADAEQKAYYEQEAKVIDKIQKDILEISRKEAPFDVFICYKETDEKGERTKDSVLANELYDRLEKEGIKTFFSRITLEDKLGTAYEPYIFAALNSARVMVVFGTTPEHFTSVWVKNEWSRFLGAIKRGQEKYLIPAYQGMSPYDMPEEFSNLQAQDLSKLGWLQDLVRGIKKLLQDHEVQGHSKPDETGMPDECKIVFHLLKHGEWAAADRENWNYLESHPEEPYGYLANLLIQLKCHSAEELEFCQQPFDQNASYKKLMQFSSGALKRQIMRYNTIIRERISRIKDESARNSKYQKACELVEAGGIENKRSAAELLKELSGWKDSERMLGQVNRELNIYDRYNAYLQQYPELVQHSDAQRIHTDLVEMLNKTKFWKIQISPVAITALVVSLLFLIKSQIVWFVVFMVLSVAIYLFRRWYQRIGIAGALMENKKQMEELSEIPDFFEFAPEMKACRPEAEAYIAKVQNISKDQAMSEWENTKEQVLEQREEEKIMQLNTLEDNYNKSKAALVDQRYRTVGDYTRRHDELCWEKSDISNRLASLNFLQIAEKKSLKNKLPLIDSELNALETTKNRDLQEIDGKLHSLDQEYMDRKNNIDQDIAVQLPIPKSPDEIEASNIYKTAHAAAKKQRWIQVKQLHKGGKEYRGKLKSIIKEYS